MNFHDPALSGSANYLVLTPELRVLDASEGYLNATLLWRNDVRGCEMFELFPNNPNDPDANGAQKLEASFEKVLRDGKAHRMDLQRYDIRDHVGGGTEWVEKHWAPMNFPIFGEDGRKIQYLVHQVNDVTHLVLLRRLIEEQSAVLEEQRRTMEEMWGEVILRQNQMRGYHQRVVRVLAARHFQGYSLADMAAELDAPDLPRYFAPGDTAPRTGTYRIVHSGGCDARLKALPRNAGEGFPMCYRCHDEVRYRLERRP